MTASEWNSRAGVLALGCVVGAAACTGMSGCNKKWNEERTIGGVYSPPTITESAMPPLETDGEPELAEASLFSLDRDNWSTTVFTVPNALPTHAPVYHSDVYDNLTTVRNQGKYPTTDSVHQTANYDGQREQVREALLAPFVAAGDIVLFLPRAVYKRPWFATRSGLQGPDHGAYARAPRMDPSYWPEPVGEPSFPMTNNPPVLPSATAPAPSAAEPGTAPAAAPGMAPAAPAAPMPPSPPSPAEPEEEVGQPAGHIGVGDGMGGGRK